MRRATLNLYLAIVMLLLSLVEGTSGFILWLALPSGGGREHGDGLGNEVYWGIARNTWIDVHNWVAVALLVIVTIHVYLHWRWIMLMLKQTFRGHLWHR
jgi:hypothetical protein